MGLNGKGRRDRCLVGAADAAFGQWGHAALYFHKLKVDNMEPYQLHRDFWRIMTVPTYRQTIDVF